MTISYSANLGLINITTGTESGLWGNYTNTNICSLLEQAVTGYGTQVMAAAADTAVSITNGALSTGRNMYIKCTSAMTQANNLIVPTVSKLYYIENATTGGFNITVKTSGGTGIVVAPGIKKVLLCDGTNVIDAINSITFTSLSVTSLTASGAVTAATLVSTGTTTASALVPSGSAVPTNGVYLPAPNTLGFATNSTTRGNINASGAWTIAAPTAGNHTVNLLSGSNGIAFSTFYGTTATCNIYFDGSVYYQFGPTTNHGLKLLSNNSVVATFSAGGGMILPVITAGEAASLVATGAAYTPSTTVSASTSTLAINTKTSNVFNINLVSAVNVTAFNINNVVLFDGQTINLFITQPSSGTAASLAWPAGFKWPGGTVPSISSTLGAVDLVVATYRSATGFWYATISKAFS